MNYFKVNVPITRSFQRPLPKSAARLAAFSPTSASAAQHAFCTYYQVQKWLGNHLDPEGWGWCRQRGELMPIKTKLEPAPQAMQKIIRCSCKSTYKGKGLMFKLTVFVSVEWSTIY